MSRSKKGAKPSGWDYWGKRLIGWGSWGTKAKRLGLKSERAKLKEDTAAQPLEPEYDEREWVPDTTDAREFASDPSGFGKVVDMINSIPFSGCTCDPKRSPAICEFCVSSEINKDRAEEIKQLEEYTKEKKDA